MDFFGRVSASGPRYFLFEQKVPKNSPEPLRFRPSGFCRVAHGVGHNDCKGSTGVSPTEMYLSVVRLPALAMLPIRVIASAADQDDPNLVWIRIAAPLTKSVGLHRTIG